MSHLNRRSFIKTAAAVTLTAQHLLKKNAAAQESEKLKRKFKMNLNISQVGVKADPFEAIDLAKQYGYQSITPMTDAIIKYPPTRRQQLAEQMKAANLSWGPTGVRPFFSPDQPDLEQKLKQLSKTASILGPIGVTRAFTWLMPGSDTLTYRKNFRLHAERLREICRLLADHNISFGIEYLGTKTLVLRFKYPFVQTLAEARELTAEVGTSNIGIALDSWHWFQAGDTEADILTLKNTDVICADICDAPADVAKNQMPDSPRRLPCTTGVIDVKSFLSGLVKIGYDGPVGTEPFDKSLAEMPTEQAMTTATNAMNTAFALIE